VAPIAAGLADVQDDRLFDPMGLKLGDRYRWVLSLEVSAATQRREAARPRGIAQNEVYTGFPRHGAAPVLLKIAHGTVVDWRSSVIAEVTKWGKAKGGIQARDGQGAQGRAPVDQTR
jgi:hypothetical protein